MEKPPWDPMKAAFWLIVVAIGLHAFVVIAAVLFCALYIYENPMKLGVCADLREQMSQLLAAVLAAALACYAAFKQPPGGDSK